jgi:soluble lytic murein transglycosylase
MVKLSPKSCLIWLALIIFFAQGDLLADIYRYRDENGVWHFTNIKTDTRYKLYLKTGNEKPAEFIEKYNNIIEQASRKFSMKSSLIKAVIRAESGFDHRAVSKKGAKGLMQLMPETANELEVSDPYNPEENIFGGTKYLSSLMKRFNNNTEHALAAYNAGPERVEEYKGIPPYSETRTFIERVLKYSNEYETVSRE